MEKKEEKKVKRRLKRITTVCSHITSQQQFGLVTNLDWLKTGEKKSKKYINK